MNALKDIIQLCHKRHSTAVRQRKTVVTPALYKSIPYNFKVQCARRCPLMLDDLERANISFMPIGHAPENDRGPRDLAGDRFLKRQGIGDWGLKRWNASWGIQVYTGIPSERDGARWHDFDFKYEAICAAPDAVSICIEALVKTTAKPLLTLTKSGGLRFSCRVPGYLHPKTDAAQSYTYKYAPTPEDPHHRDVYLEVIGENGYSRWDGRYEILMGNLLDPPVIAKEVLFVPINAFRAVLHEPEPHGETYFETAPAPSIAPPTSLGSETLDLAKAAFFQRGFSYLQEDNDFHHWTRRDSTGDDTHATLWEDQGVVWVRTATPSTGLPTSAVPITDIWNDTGITSSISNTGSPLSDKMLAVREGKLSPLAIKRLQPILHRGEPTQKVYATPEENANQIQPVFKKDARVIGVIAEALPGTDLIVESYLRSGGATCLNVASRKLVEAVEQRYQARDLPSFARWRARMYRWQRVKDIPVAARMANPFQHGNPCEDPERCNALEKKGGSAYESICPKCPVYTECQARGYLSQPAVLQRAKAQISPVYQIFLDPQRTESLEQILDPADGAERICIIDENNIALTHLFIECVLPIDVLKKWTVSWRGSVLGNFAQALLDALQLHGAPNGDAIARIRAATDGFQQHEDELIRQMCNVNVRGKVVALPTVDSETGKELARFAIAFEGGTSASIPLDADAEDRLKEKEVPFFALRSFTPNEDIEIPMSMEQAIELRVLDTETVQKIQEFPTIYRNPNWTLWHQLKRFFVHYERDADAPMRWNDTILRFGMPPILHPNIKRLLLISPTLSKHYLQEVFPNDEVEMVHVQPTAWVPGNRVFQIRTGIYTRHAILNYDSDWDTPSLSKIGERFFFGIRAEIDRDPSVKHAVITNIAIAKQLTEVAAKENVCFVTDFGNIDAVDATLEDIHVLWIVGMPHWAQQTIWWLAQMLFGNDAAPLSYETEIKPGHYKDKRVQAVYDQCIVDSLTKVVGRARLNISAGKTVMLLTSLELPNITDRPETLLFDWEDFQIAGGLDKLAEVIATREHFEAERDNLNAESSRQEVERVLGCSSRKANRVLQKLRGGNIQRVSFETQIRSLLADGEKKASELSTAIGSSPQSVGNELKRLVDIGRIVKVRRGVYALPEA